MTEPEDTTTTSEPLDATAGWHRQMAAECFNKAWDLIEVEERSPDQDRQMLLLTCASRFHWGIVGEDQNWMVGNWQIAHVASLLGLGDLAMHFAPAALDICRGNGWDDWRLASALEGMARASAAVGDTAGRDRFAAESRRVLATIEDKENRELIASQLASIPGIGPA